MEFQFEGSTRYARRVPGIDVGADGLYQSFSGEFLFRSDYSVWVDVYHSYVGRSDVYRETACLLKGKSEKVGRSMDEPPSHPEMHQGPQALKDLCFLGSPANIIGLLALRHPLADNSVEMRHLGSEITDSRTCELFEFNYTPGRPWNDKAALLDRVWIDVERDCSILRLETRWGEAKPFYRIGDVKLQQYSDGGARIWLPISASITWFNYFTDRGEEKHSDAPVRVMELYILRNTVNLSPRAPDSRFKLSSTSGATPSASLGALQSRFLRYEPTTSGDSRQVETDLARLVEDAERQRGQVRATSTARGRGEWLSLLPWGVAICALLLLLILLLRGRLRS